MELYNIFKSYDINRTCPPKRITVTHVNDVNTRTIELELTQGDEKLVPESGCAAFASFVDRRTKQLIRDSTGCSINESGNILIPIDDLHFHGKKDVNIEVCVKNESQQQVLALPFPLWVRVNPSILDDAEVTEDSLGTVPELLAEAREALDVDGKEEKANKRTSIPIQAQSGDDDKNYPTVGAVRDYVSPRTQTEVIYDDIAYEDQYAPESNEHYMLFFGEQASPGSTAVNLGLPQLTEADYGRAYHFEIAFETANFKNSGVILQEYDDQGAVHNFKQYKPITQGDIIRFDYTMSADNIIKFRMRMYENAGPQKIRVKIIKDIQVTEYTYPKSVIDERIDRKADLSVFDTEPAFSQRQGTTVSGCTLINTGLPSQSSGTSILIADVEGGEKLKISGRPAVAKIYYCSFFSEDIEFDSSQPNGGFSSEYFIGGLRNTEATSIENYVDILVTAPENAKKVIVSGSNSLVPSVYSETGKQLKRKWSGKKWCAVGDSLTEKNNAATKNYTDYIAEATGIEVINMGQSGTGYKQEENRGHAFYQRINEVPTDSDVVTIFGSLNDAGYIYNQITIPWNTAEPRKVINANGEIVSGGASSSYIVSEPIPAIPGRYYRIKTRMRGANAFFVFKDANNEPLYVEKLVNADGTYPTDYSSYLDYDGYVKAPKYAKYLYISSSVNGNATYTYAAEDNLGTVDDGLVPGDVPNGQETENYTTTLCGCINSTINNLYKIMPTVNLGIISSIPWIQYNAFNSPSCILYIEALEAICKKRGIPFLNLFYESNLRPWNQEFIDLMYKHGNHDHPDEDAHKLFAPRIEAFLEKLL